MCPASIQSKTLRFLQHWVSFLRGGMKTSGTAAVRRRRGRERKKTRGRKRRKWDGKRTAAVWRKGLDIKMAWVQYREEEEDKNRWSNLRKKRTRKWSEFYKSTTWRRRRRRGGRQGKGIRKKDARKRTKTRDDCYSIFAFCYFNVMWF